MAPLVSPQERQRIKEFYRNSFDMIFDLRHYRYLCALARESDRPVWRVLMAILDKAFAGRMDPIDDLLDRPLRYVRSRLERIRKQPERENALIADRLEEIRQIAIAWPDEVDPDDELFFSDLLGKAIRREKTVRDKSLGEQVALARKNSMARCNKNQYRNKGKNDV